LSGVSALLPHIYIMQRGAKDFANKASVNAEKSFFNYFLECFGEKKKFGS